MGRLKKSHARTQGSDAVGVDCARHAAAPTKKKKSVSSAKSKTSSKSSSPKKKQKVAVEVKKDDRSRSRGSDPSRNGRRDRRGRRARYSGLGDPRGVVNEVAGQKAAMLGMAKFVTEKDKSEWATRESSVIALYSCAFRATREFKDSNFNIINASFELVTVISKQCGKLLARSRSESSSSPPESSEIVRSARKLRRSSLHCRNIVADRRFAAR